MIRFRTMCGVGMLLAMAAVAACSGDDEVTQTVDAAPDAPDAPDAATSGALDCDVAIVGGGVGGLHTAYRLAPTLGDKVCVFEKEAELGGRILDIALDPTDPESPRFGAGAMRVMEGQEVLFSLATELGITFETPELEGDFLNARGEWAFSKESLVDRYGVTPDKSGDTESAFYYALGLQAARPDIGDYADFRSYINAKVGGEGLEFLRDMSRFRADFEYPIDARSYMDYLDEEWDVCCTPSYPVGGMSRFVVGMAERATTDGARIFTSEPVATIARAGDGYRLVTANHVVNADKVVIAIPPRALGFVGGDIAEEIKAQAQFQAILGVKVVTIAQWWPSRWWANLTNPGLEAPLNNLWRAWSTEHCFNTIEMPLQAYAVDQAATRSVYNDNLDCSNYWELLHMLGGTAAVEAEIRHGLEYMFNTTGLAGMVTIPAPLKTHVQIWPDGWHWLAAGTPYTNAQIFDWAVEPIAGEEVALVGEAYNVSRSGWSDAAYKSSINLLNTKYGLSLPVLKRAPKRTSAPGLWPRLGRH